jgi:hypothetical protein
LIHKKTLVLIVLILSFLTFTFGQKKQSISYRVQIDSIGQSHDSTLYKILDFENDEVKRETMAFLFPDSFVTPRHRLTGKLFTKTSYCKRVLKHGETIEYLSEGRKKITNYSYGNLILTKYLDKNEMEISQPQDIDYVAPCGIVTGEYIIEGSKKVKPEKK